MGDDKPEFTIQSDPDGGTSFWSNSHPIMVRLFDLEPTRGGDIRAQIEVRWNAEPSAGLIHSGSVALGSTTRALARDLSRQRTAVPEGEWADLLAKVSHIAKTRFIEGEPFAFLGSEPQPTRYVVPPLVVASGPTVISAEGGSSKSFIGMALTLTVAMGTSKFLGLKPAMQGPVLYLDWEDAENTHNERAWALLRGAGFDPIKDFPREDVIYSREWVPLAQSVRAVSRKVAKLPRRPVLVIIDSVGKARGGDVSSAEDTNRLFAAIDKLGLPAFCIDHKSKEAIGRKQPGPIGSVYTWNSARMVWDLEKSQTIGSDDLRVVLRNVKSNSSRLQKSRAYEVTFENEGEGINEHLVATKFRGIDPFSVTSLNFAEASTLDTLIDVLSRSDLPLSTARLADITGKTPSAIRTTLSRYGDTFMQVDGKGNERLWTVNDRRIQDELPDNII